MTTVEQSLGKGVAATLVVARADDEILGAGRDKPVAYGSSV